ncbi:MAG: hypothetical protein K2K56_14600, partial [Lachnospiraceae bacterium]|nr:hypothetical protein [Lachnospiraceae bacterium]
MFDFFKEKKTSECNPEIHADDEISNEDTLTPQLNETEEEMAEEKEKGFFSRLKAGLAKTRNSINESFDN